MLVEETSGSMRVEGLEIYKRRDLCGTLRRDVAMAPGLTKFTTEQMAQARIFVVDEHDTPTLVARLQA